MYNTCPVTSHVTTVTVICITHALSHVITCEGLADHRPRLCDIRIYLTHQQTQTPEAQHQQAQMTCSAAVVHDVRIYVMSSTSLA